MTDKRPIISIIVPVYNVEKTLSRCIESVLSQTFTDWELILVDDGSPDDSGLICDKYAEKDERIHVIHKQNGGVSSARNAGLDNTKGKYIWFVDADDWVEHDSVELLLHKIETFKSDICFFGLEPISEDNVSAPFSFDSICDGKTEMFFENKNGCAEAIARIEMCGGLGWAWNKIFRRSIIENGRIRFDIRFSIQEDHLFTLSYLLYVNRILVMNYAPYNYVITGKSLSSRRQTFQSTKERNSAMLESRLKLCEAINIKDRLYIDWFTSDYATRMVANLRMLKETNLSYARRIREIQRVNIFITTYHVHLKGRARLYRCIYWLPSCLLVKLL